MKFTLLFSLLVPLGLLAQQTADVRLYCTSLRFDPSTAGPGQTETLELTSDPNFGEINGEVAALYSTNLPSHGAFFKLDDPTFPDSIMGQIAFDKPGFVDNNGNGFDDFFEVSQAVPSFTTQGVFDAGVDSGSVTATWSRAAGSPTGTCTLQLTGQMFGALPAFTHTFQLLEYTGTLKYTPASNGITSTLALSQTGSPTNTLSGPLTFTRVATNQFNQLQIGPSTLTNAANLLLTILSADLQRDLILKTNYYGFLDFVDGDPSTSVMDFYDWVLSIDDPNDSNGNGVPDFSDNPPSAEQPQLALAQPGNNLLLTITGATGQVYTLQETITLVPPTWAGTNSITLTNATQTVRLPLPNTPTRFWRLTR